MCSETKRLNFYDLSLCDSTGDHSGRKAFRSMTALCLSRSHIYTALQLPSKKKKFHKLITMAEYRGLLTLVISSFFFLRSCMNSQLAGPDPVDQLSKMRHADLVKRDVYGRVRHAWARNAHVVNSDPKHSKGVWKPAPDLLINR